MKQGKTIHPKQTLMASMMSLGPVTSGSKVNLPLLVARATDASVTP